MKTRIYQSVIVLAIAFSSANLFAQGASLEITVNNIKGTKGTIRVGLFNTEDKFLKTPLKGKVVKASGSEVKVIFEDLPSGEYAVSVVHDENENEKLDSNAIGIPKEGFAFGNNAMGSFGPPSFDRAKVKLDGKPVQQVITMKYM
jgi:uncharacterized protein (DUF2141 family)